MQIHERTGGDDRSCACEDCNEVCYLRMVRSGRVKFVALNYDIVTDPYEVIASTLERPLTMPMYEQSKAKLKVVYDSLDQLGPFPVHDWYNGSLRGSAVCTCRASTSLAPFYSPCASSAFGWG